MGMKGNKNISSFEIIIIYFYDECHSVTEVSSDIANTSKKQKTTIFVHLFYVCISLHSN